MNESGKSILLVALVFSSLILTYQLWFGLEPFEKITDDVYDPIFFEEPRPLTRAVAPRRVIFQVDGIFYRFGHGSENYQKLWEWTSELLEQVPYAQYRLAEENPREGLPLVTFSFQPALPAGDGSPWLKEDMQREIEEVIIVEQGDQYWLELQASGGAVLLLDLSVEIGYSLRELVASLNLISAAKYREVNAVELSDALEMEILLDGPLYVPAEPVQVDELLFAEEELDQEMLVKMFFVDRSLVRMITERDGSLIYTDGEKGLRFNGGFVFTHPQLEQAQATHSFIASLYSASRLLSYYGGWPDQLRLASIEREGNGYRNGSLVAYWQCYYNGIPIYGDMGAAMMFNDSGLVEYKRRLYSAVHPVGAPFVFGDFKEVIISALAIIEDKGLLPAAGTPYLVEEVELGYVAVQTTLPPHIVPAWVVRINGLDLLINARDMSWLEGVKR